ncbi:MAG: RNA methyltransferase [Burkholderiales bacterium]|nr:RNA methyltransferase [Burkholderiales bacterium]
MPIFQTIESKDNKLIKQVVKLAKDKNERLIQKQAIIYGEHLIVESLRYNKLDSIFLTEESLEKYTNIIENHEVKVYVVDEVILNKINILDSLIDAVGIINNNTENQINYNIDSLILENIQDPGNLGTILRGANASGIKQIILSPKSVDVYNPKVLRASQGIQFGLDIFCDIDLNDFIKQYQGNLLALTPSGNTSLYECNLLKTTGFIMGNEGNGISNELLNLIKDHIQIPMVGNTESLNLAMAATVAIFELSRQRIKSHG